MRIIKSLIFKMFGCALSLIFSCSSYSYPLDGADGSGIQRLKGYQITQLKQPKLGLPTGALLGVDDIHLNLMDRLFERSEKTHSLDLQSSLDSIFSSRDPSYSLVVIDYSKAENIVWAGKNIENRQNVGSVGKLITMLGFFNELAKAFPKIEDRQRILKSTKVLAGSWVIFDEHKVPEFDAQSQNNIFHVLTPTDTFSLSEFMDHMISASANGAGSVIWREAMLLQQFGNSYPVTQEVADHYFKTTPKKILSERSIALSQEPLQSIGIDTSKMQQGSFWTSTGKRIIPGQESYATPLELSKYLIALEQGKLVDVWSSLEMKRYLYMTKRRYRYAYAPELNKSAVFFKSGSLYQCQPEEGYRCGKYKGNKRNMMNSIVIIESPENVQPQYRYIVAMISNVLKVNSAWDHSRLAAAIHKAVLTRKAVEVEEVGSPEQIHQSGQSD